MQLGVVFPQTEIGNDPAVIRDYAQTAEALGYRYILAYDHVIGANPDRPGGWRPGAYTYQSAFHEPFLLYGFLAGLTRTIEFFTGILILPQRQTTLVAKQAAALDVLSGGRLRLGVGVGWNDVEYEALGQNFHTRGRRMEEQIALLRRLWTEPLVSFDGRFDHVTDAGINPLPVQRPIPIWMGGMSEVVQKRVARLADGWFPQRITPGPQAQEVLERVRADARAAARDPASLGLHVTVNAANHTPDEWAAAADAWQGLGITHVSLNTMGSGLNAPQGHIDAIRRYLEAATAKA